MHRNVILWSNIVYIYLKLYSPAIIQSKFMQYCALEPAIPTFVLFSDEMIFRQDNIFNVHNYHVFSCVYSFICDFQPHIPTQNKITI